MLDKGLLSDFAFFSDLDEDTLSAIAQKCNLLEFKPNDFIFHIDDTANDLHGVIDGEVELSLVYKDEVLKVDIQYEEALRSRLEVKETPIVIETLGPGVIFGWGPLVKRSKRKVTARCSKRCRVFSLPKADLKAMFDKDPALGYVIMGRASEIIARRLANRNERMVEIWGECFKRKKMD